MLDDSRGHGTTIDTVDQDRAWPPDNAWREFVEDRPRNTGIRLIETDRSIIIRLNPKIGWRTTMAMLGIWLAVIVLCCVVVPMFLKSGVDSVSWNTTVIIAGVVIACIPGVFGLIWIIGKEYNRESLTITKTGLVFNQNGMRVSVGRDDLLTVGLVSCSRCDELAHESVAEKRTDSPREFGAVDLVTAEGTLRVLNNWVISDLCWISQVVSLLMGISEEGVRDRRAGNGPVLIAPCHNNKDRRAVASLLFVFALLIGLFAFIYLPVGLSTYGWDQTVGKVIEVERLKRRGSSDNIVITYSYQIDGRDYANDRIWYAFRTNSEEIEQVLSNHPTGSAIPVYYDPSSPSRSVLVRGIDPVLYLLMPFPLVMIAISLWMWKKGLSPEQARLHHKYVQTNSKGH